MKQSMSSSETSMLQKAVDSLTHSSSGDHFDADLLTKIPDLVVADRPILRLL